MLFVFFWFSGGAGARGRGAVRPLGRQPADAAAAGGLGGALAVGRQADARGDLRRGGRGDGQTGLETGRGERRVWENGKAHRTFPAIEVGAKNPQRHESACKCPPKVFN